jgi:hypothetical protein
VTATALSGTAKAHVWQESWDDSIQPRPILGDDGRPIRHRDIHLGSDIFNSPEYAIFVILHEATHKYANTEDYDIQGYTAYLDSLAYKKPGLTKAQALKNAESYAQVPRFVAQSMTRLRPSNRYFWASTRPPLQTADG